jgi:hypothetical protein
MHQIIEKSTVLKNLAQKVTVDMFTDIFPQGLQTAMAKYIRMCVYCEANRASKVDGIEFLTNILKMDTPEKGSHARSGWMCAKAVLAFLAVHKTDDDGKSVADLMKRPGIGKLICDIGLEKVACIAFFVSCPRTKESVWKKDGVEKKVFVSEYVNIQHEQWMSKLWAKQVQNQRLLDD